VLDHRIIVECNALFAKMWRGSREDLLGLSFAVLYAGERDFDLRGKIAGPILAKRGAYSDRWLMKRLDGDVFWSHVSGATVDQKAPYARAIWTFIDLTIEPQMASSVRASLTPREREIAMLLVDRCSSKDIARRLDISPRTVHVHRASLLRKYAVTNTSDLCKALITI